MSIEDAYQRYTSAAHAMQSGVAAKMERDPSETTPKHLRTGVNSSMVENSALVKLLVSKGILTDEEWAEALADGMEAEVRLYEKWLSENLGATITLG
jgi:hypothetical protein